MISATMGGARRGLALLAAAAMLAAGASAAAAQEASRLPPGAVVQPLDDAQGAELRRHLNTLADNPRSLDALIGAGRAALRGGDIQAALSFFGRADEISPRDARVKAGMASALVQLGQAQTALSLFADAVALGAPEAEIAGDRGLAFDMVGDPRRAQQDYALSLTHRDDDEVRRRLALSLAIAGQRDAALRLIDPQLRRHDRAGWRVHAFVLALTGDVAGARRSAESVMPMGTAEAMAPFLARLASLSPAQKAMAVHFGHFPADGRADAAAAVSADPGAVALAMGGPPPPPAAQPRTSQPAATPAATRRRPETVRRAERPDPSDRFGLRGTRRPPQRQSSQPPPPAQQPPAQPPPAQQTQPAETRWAGAAPESRPPQAEPAPPEPRPARTGPVEVEVAQSTAPTRIEPAPGFSLTPAEPPPTAAGPSREPLADIEALVESLPDEPARRPAAPPSAPEPRPEPVRTAQAQPPAQRPAAQRQASRRAQPAHPSRHWVQVAGGANRAALPREFARLREQAGEELRGRAAWLSRTPTSNRLLVGPFASADEAQAFVNRLARRNVAAFAWTSPAGQEIERLPAR